MSAHSELRSRMSNAFWKSTKLIYSEEFHSSICSTIRRSVAMWSVHDLSFRKPACWFVSSASSVVVSLSKIILFNTLPGTDSNIIPRWFLHSLRLPFFVSFIRCPPLHCSGISSSSHMCSNSSYTNKKINTYSKKQNFISSSVDNLI